MSELFLIPFRTQTIEILIENFVHIFSHKITFFCKKNLKLQKLFKSPHPSIKHLFYKIIQYFFYSSST